MGMVIDAIGEWLKEILVSGIIGNLSGLFDSVNGQVADISAQVGATPQAWNAAIYNMIRSLSENVIIPIAGVILAFVMTLELIQMVSDKNNMHGDVDTWMFFKWIFKTACAVLIVTNTWNIVMGVFDVGQSVVNSAAGVISSDASIDISSIVVDLEQRLMEMDIGPLIGLWFQSLFVGICTWALTICIFIITYRFLNEQIKDRHTEEVEAESISFAVCAYYGIATGENSFGYIAAWSKDKELPELRASLETINKTSSELISDIDRHYAEIMKERETEMIAAPEEEKNLEEMNILEMVAYFMEQGMTEEQANDLANSEWRARKANQASVEESSEPVIELPVEEVPPVQAPDNGDMPDPSMSIEAMNAYGYTDSDMLPLSKERALELFERDVPIYMLYDGNTEAMAFEAEDIVLFSGCFGITREDWDAIKDQIPPMDVEMVRQKREQAFHESPGDTYAIYQLKRNDATADLRFMNSEWLQKKGIEPQYENYELVYTGTLSKEGSQIEKLENLYRVFNVEHPQDFTGHSLSISDIVALKQAGVVSYHYVDSVGYQELTNFRNTDNHLKNAEMQLEDDYGMIDGVINNGPKEPVTPAPKKEEVKTKKPSVLAKLRKYQEEDRKTATQHRSAERDL